MDKRLVVLVALLSAFCLRTTAQQVPESGGPSFKIKRAADQKRTDSEFWNQKSNKPKFDFEKVFGRKLDYFSSTFDKFIGNQIDLNELMSEKFSDQETGIMELEFDGPSSCKSAVIDFRRGTLTIFDNEDQEPTTLYFSDPRTFTLFNDEKQEREVFQTRSHGKTYGTWTNPFITEMYIIRINRMDNEWTEMITLTQNKHRQCFMRMTYPFERYYHIRSITRKDAQ